MYMVKNLNENTMASKIQRIKQRINKNELDTKSIHNINNTFKRIRKEINSTDGPIKIKKRIKNIKHRMDKKIDNNKIYVYKGTGGLFHNLKGLSSAVRQALQDNHILIIDMLIHRPFGGTFSEYFIINDTKLKYFDHYNSLPNYLNKDINMIKNKDAGTFGYFNEKKNKFKLGSNRLVNVIYGFSHICINSSIQINSIINNKLLSEDAVEGPYIAIHFRNTDIKNDIESFIPKIKIGIEMNNIHTIYLATDDYYSYDTLKTNFPLINIVRKTYPPKDIPNLHYGSSPEDNKKQMYESIRDVYFILKSDLFIPSMNSSFSKSIVDIIHGRHEFFPGLISSTKII